MSTSRPRSVQFCACTLCGSQLEIPRTPVRTRFLRGASIALIAACTNSAPAPDVESAVSPIISGSDDRLDIFELDPNSAEHRNADAVGVLANNQSFVVEDGALVLNVTPMQQRFNTCSDVRYASQPIFNFAFCTAFLVAPRLVVTAGHCFDFQPEGTDLSAWSIVFGFRMLDAAAAPSRIPLADVYRATRVLVQCPGPDCMLIELERPVTNHVIVDLRRDGFPTTDDSVYVLGYPFGLPLKYDGPSPLFRVVPEQEVFVTDQLDTAGGNSGSPLFNANTHLVEGIFTSRSNSGDISDLEPSPAGCTIEHVAVPEDNLFGTGYLTSSFAPFVPPRCSADANTWNGCGSSGCSVCEQALDLERYDLYFERHPNCVVEGACDSPGACSEACPAPTADDSSEKPCTRHNLESCSIAELCPCRGNHVRYVTCVARAAAKLLERHLIDRKVAVESVIDAIHARCGRGRHH